MVASIGGKQPLRVSMRHPVVSQNLQGIAGQRHIAVFSSLTAMNMHHHPLGVDITDLQMQPFL
mgnify:CR=1 FL=1